LLFHNAVRRWKSAVGSAAGTIQLFSPFITANTIERIIAEAEPGNCELYMSFVPSITQAAHRLFRR
jgi:hypothetical protein